MKPARPERLTIEACRALLGPKGAAMSDREIEDLRERLYLLARVAVEMWQDAASEEWEPRDSSTLLSNPAP